jgi:superfamily I DNA and RNA helicase
MNQFSFRSFHPHCGFEKITVIKLTTAFTIYTRNTRKTLQHYLSGTMAAIDQLIKQLQRKQKNHYMYRSEMIIKQIFTVKHKIQIVIQADISTIISKNRKKKKI